MRPWLILLLCISFCSSCKKDEKALPSAEQDYYPHVDRFAGTTHVTHDFGYSIPPFTYDSSYQDVIEVIYTDSNWVDFNFSYWDVTDMQNGTFPGRLNTRTVSLLKRPDNRYTFDSGHHYESHISITGDSLLMNKYSRWAGSDETLMVRFSGKK
jgi:hypothetical protein